jgi:hypothetical protein
MVTVNVDVFNLYEVRSLLENNTYRERERERERRPRLYITDFK